MVRDNICRGSHSYVPVIAGPAGNKTERGPGDFMHEKALHPRIPLHFSHFRLRTILTYRETGYCPDLPEVQWFPHYRDTSVIQ